MTEKGKAIIDGVEYTIDSDNRQLLKKLDGGKRKNEETGKWEEVQYDYLPLSTILALMDGIFLSYDFYSEPAKYCWEEYIVDKKSYINGKLTDVKDTIRVYEKTVSIDVRLPSWEERHVTGYAQSVASVKQLTSDPSRNGFMQKLAARARKEALKNLGRVFRVLDEDGDDNELISESVETVSKGSVILPGKPSAQSVDAIVKELDQADATAIDEHYNRYMDKLRREYEIFFDEGIFYQQNLISTIAMLKAEEKLMPWSAQLKALEKIYNEIIIRAQDYKA